MSEQPTEEEACDTWEHIVMEEGHWRYIVVKGKGQPPIKIPRPEQVW